MKLKYLLLYSIHATYRRKQMTETPKSLRETSMAGRLGRRENEKESRQHLDDDGVRNISKGCLTTLHTSMVVVVRDVSLRLFWLHARSLLTHWRTTAAHLPVLQQQKCRKRQKYEAEIASSL